MIFLKLIKIIVLLLVLITPLIFDSSVNDPLLPNSSFDYPKRVVVNFGAIIIMLLILIQGANNGFSSISKNVNLTTFLFLVFCAWCLLTASWASSPAITIWETHYLLLYFFLVLGINIVTSEYDFAMNIFKIMFLMAMMQAVLGIIQFFRLDFLLIPVLGKGIVFQPVSELMGKRAMVTGLMGNQTFFASYLGLVIPITLVLLGNARRPLPKTCYIVGFLVIVTAILLSHTRIIIFGIVIYVICWMYFNLLNMKNINHKLISVVLPILVISITATMFAKIPTLSTRFKLISKFDQGSVASRLYTWKITWTMIKDRLILGHGWGNYQLVYYEYQCDVNRDGKMPIHPGNYPLVARAHNELLHVWSETGIIGVLLISTMIFNTFKTIYKKMKIATMDIRNLLLGCTGALSIGLLASLVSFPFRIVPPLVILLLVLGIIHSIKVNRQT